VTRRIVVEQAAEMDLFEAIAYYRREGTPATARRFLDAAQDTFAQLAQMPGMGRAYQTNRPQLQHLHIWRVRGFASFLIFYHATDDTLFIVRVLHGARDIEYLLGDELG
jgi:toxin ParE1/3/4